MAYFYNGRGFKSPVLSSTFSHTLPLFSGQLPLLDRHTYTDSGVMPTNGGGEQSKVTVDCRNLSGIDFWLQNWSTGYITGWPF